MPSSSHLTPAELRRYARHLSMPEFGVEAQEKLKAARVLCIGAGGLGSPVTMYLAAAGVGTIGIIDADVVEESNLQRQLLHGTSDVGRTKLESAQKRLHDINPNVQVELHPLRFTSENAMDLVAKYDVVIDGTDNFPTRYLSNDVCVFLKKPNIYGSILRFEGQCSVFASHLEGPCYRCMAPQPPPPGLVPSCAEGGVLGVLPGLIGTMQATEAIKLITGIGQPLVGRLLHVDTLSMKFRTFNLRRDPECPVCGDHPSIIEPIDYEGFCGLPSPKSMSTETKDAIPAMTVQELQELRESGAPFTLLDVREAFERDIAIIEGAEHIPLGQLGERLEEIPRDKKLVVHCKSGGRSAKAVGLLREAGFDDVWNVTGGINAWSKEIDPSVALY
ncbi:molybdopterin-synthase adenylyltransferase MoeB [Roseimicrobium sp. ORNL1]|uniref:molybdopterin-synthase adenylyltransferase MoeB n=1 Tax=Roseimicrobium sp. ORNL1 TaxID=2711231 RepID=UPI001F104DFD|nr:molybdopterin-synthase adenylyltransferase MoeB [Roseimicrobium sp. ORNL1]